MLTSSLQWHAIIDLDYEDFKSFDYKVLIILTYLWLLITLLICGYHLPTIIISHLWLNIFTIHAKSFEKRRPELLVFNITIIPGEKVYINCFH